MAKWKPDIQDLVAMENRYAEYQRIALCGRIKQKWYE